MHALTKHDKSQDDLPYRIQSENHIFRKPTPTVPRKVDLSIVKEEVMREKHSNNDNGYLLDFDIRWCKEKFPSMKINEIKYFLNKANGVLPLAVNYIFRSYIS